MSMPTTRMGASGAEVSRICLGTMGFGSSQWRPWVKGEAESIPIIRRALDLGINFLDTADMYSRGESERIVGKAIEGRRDDVVLATKLYHPLREAPNARGLSRLHIEHAIRDSLARLGTDHVDLYQIHRFDERAPPDEALSSLSRLVDDGRVRYLGASTMYAWQFALALARQREKGWHSFVTMQDHYNLVYREEEREMLPLCRHEGIGVIPWSPLARGYLAGAPRRARGERDAGWKFYDTPEARAIAERVDELSSAKSVSPAQIALAWLLHQDAVTAPIVGATKVEHVEDAVAALSIRLSEKDLEWLEEPYRPRGIAGWFRSGSVPRQHLDPHEPEQV